MPKSAVLTEGPIGKNLLLFALPILAGNIAQSLNGSINAIWVGRYLGEAALTAAANANSIMFFLIGSVFGIGMASTILIGQAMGARDIAQARKVMGTSASFFGGLSAAIAVFGWFLAPHLLTAMGTPPASQTLAEEYLRVIFLAMPLIYVFAFLSAALRGTGDARTPFRFLLVSVVLDIVFNPLLIFGLGPFPALGIAGAAWATLLAQVVALGGLLLYLRKKRHVLWLGRGDLQLFRISPTILRALIVKGVPMGLQMVLISLSMIAMMTLVNGFGTDTAAAYGAALQLWTYVQMPAMALGAACSTMAAQNVCRSLEPRRCDRTHRHRRQLFDDRHSDRAADPVRSLDARAVPADRQPDAGSGAASQSHRHLVVPAVWRELRHFRRGARDRRGDPAAADPGIRSMGCARAAGERLDPASGSRRHLVESSDQFGVLYAAVAGVLPLGRLAQGAHVDHACGSGGAGGRCGGSGTPGFAGRRYGTVDGIAAASPALMSTGSAENRRSRAHTFPRTLWDPHLPIPDSHNANGRPKAAVWQWQKQPASVAYCALAAAWRAALACAAAARSSLMRAALPSRPRR